MKYMGSKARIAKDIAPIINDLIQKNGILTYIEPFVGGANMIQHINCRFKYGCDNNHYLIAFLDAVQAGWNPFDEYPEISKELYTYIKNHPDDFPDRVVALAGFCASYNGKWFGGYAGKVNTKIGTVRDYYKESVSNVLKQAPNISDVKFMYLDYRDWEPENALIYCDPPYQGKTGYKSDFDHSEYWEWVRKVSEKNIVICSEYEAPDDFSCIWSKQLTTTLDKSSRSTATEKLFIYKKEKKSTMELRVNAAALPETAISFNYEELKKEILEKIEFYSTVVYTDDQIKEAKSDRAALNSLKKALNDERIRREREYMQPFKLFKSQITEIIEIIDKPCGLIDKQIKEYEEAQKAQKLETVKNLFAELGFPERVKFESVADPKWLNASVSLKSIKAELENRLERINGDLAVIEGLPFAFESSECYLETLDLSKAVHESKRLQEQAERKAAQEAARKAAQESAQQPEAVRHEIIPDAPINAHRGEDSPNTGEAVSVDRKWIRFQALLSEAEARALGNYLRSNNIQYKGC